MSFAYGISISSVMRTSRHACKFGFCFGIYRMKRRGGGCILIFLHLSGLDI